MLINVQSKVAVLLYSLIVCASIERILHCAGWPWWVTLPIIAIWFYSYWKTGNNSWKVFMSQWDQKRQLDYFSGAMVHLRILGTILIEWAGAAFGYGLAAWVFRCEGWIAKLAHRVPYLADMLSLDMPCRLSQNEIVQWIQYGIFHIPPEKPGLLGIMRYIVAFLCMMIFGWVASAYLLPKEERYRRGSKMRSYPEAKKESKRHLTKGDSGLPWGGINLPSESATQHFFVAGTPGSGKTLTIRMLMQQTLNRIGHTRKHRAVILDPKQEYLPYLKGMNLRCPIIIANPFDKDSSAWDIAADCNSPAGAREVASIIIPQDGGQNRFFYDAARHIITGVIIGLNKRFSGKWTFRDLILILKNKSYIQKHLREVPEVVETLGYADNASTFNDICSTILTQIAPFETVAAAWSHTTRTFSLKQFVKSESILLLTAIEEVREPMNAIYRVIFKRLCEFTLSQKDSQERRVWFFLDELREAGCLDGLGRLLNQGRSKGVCIVLGFQDWQGLQEVFGEKPANEILGQCGNKAILRTTNPESAASLASMIGDYETMEQNASYKGKGQNSPQQASNVADATSVSESISKRSSILPSEIASLPPANKKNGLSGYYITPNIGCYQTCITGEQLKMTLKPPSKKTKAFRPRDPKHQILQPFGKEELERLGLSQLDSSWSPTRTSTKVTPEQEPELKVVGNLRKGKPK